MSEPEIARRCRNCGASIREVALFCPQCGNAQPQPQTRAAEPAPDTTSKSTAPLEESEVESPQKSMSDTIAIEKPEGPAKTSTSVRGAVGEKVQRVATLARGVEDDVMHRVQKARQISHVVLDEAGYDPGLRFLLAAVIVFVLFLVILLLNKLIT